MREENPLDRLIGADEVAVKSIPSLPLGLGHVALEIALFERETYLP